MTAETSPSQPKNDSADSRASAEARLRRLFEGRPAPPRVVWAIRALAVAGLALASYLTWLALSGRVAIGCASGGGCDAVLGSAWSSWLRVVPVALPAALLYVVVLLATCFVGPRASYERRTIASAVLAAAAVTFTGAAVWFLCLQLFWLKQLCPYCVAEHAIGLVMSTLILASADAGRHVPKALITGGLCVALLVGGQLALPGKTLRQFSYAGQAIKVTGDWPILGDADAPHVIVYMFDYRCPKCRDMHGYLTETRRRFGGKVAFLAMPTPRDSACNDTISETEAPFVGSCRVAEIALAVQLTQPGAFAEFDDWLFEPADGRTPDAAHAKAAEVVGEEALKTMLDSQLPRAMLAQAIAHHKRLLNADPELYSGVPKLLVNQEVILVSLPHDADELIDTLEEVLKIEAN